MRILCIEWKKNEKPLPTRTISGKRYWQMGFPELNLNNLRSKYNSWIEMQIKYTKNSVAFAPDVCQILLRILYQLILCIFCTLFTVYATRFTLFKNSSWRYLGFKILGCPWPCSALDTTKGSLIPLLIWQRGNRENGQKTANNKNT